MLAASSPGTYRLISWRLLPSPDRDSAVGPRFALNFGRISGSRKAALNLGYLTAVQFGPMSAARGHDASSGVIVAAGRGIAFVVSRINGAMARRSISAFPCARRRRTLPGMRG
jgi:hypothetical protein